MTLTKRVRIPALLIAMGLMAAACGGDGGAAVTTMAAATTTAPATAAMEEADAVSTNIWKYPPSIVAMIIVLPHIDWIAT